MDANMGNLFIVAAPSGGGKTSLVKRVSESLGNLEISISHTTRTPRPGEKEGEAYFFVNENEFLDMIKKDAFLEHACVFNKHYGTSKAQIDKRLLKGIDVLLDIDWQGAQQICHLYPDAVSIFILPPSLNTLKQRLQERKQDNEHTIDIRMQRARDELSHFMQFDYLLVNDDFEQAAQELQAIIQVNRLTTKRQSRKIENLLSLLLTSK